jgi:predicted nucleic acid-binding protein
LSFPPAPIVSDSTPLHYLILIGEIGVLEKLFQAVLLPEAVVRELSMPQAPAAVRKWIESPPSWIRIARGSDAASLPFPRLGPGEREAIALAQHSRNSILLTDDFQARAAAESLKIAVLPTIRVLSIASSLGFVDFEDALTRLQQTNFRVSAKVMDAIRKQRAAKEE